MKTNKLQKHVPPLKTEKRRPPTEKRGQSFKERLAQQRPKQRPKTKSGVPIAFKEDHFASKCESKRESKPESKSVYDNAKLESPLRDSDLSKENKKPTADTTETKPRDDASSATNETSLEPQLITMRFEQHPEKIVAPSTPISATEIDSIVTAIHVEETKNPIVFIDVKLASGNVRIELATRNKRTSIKLSTKCEKLRRKLQASKSELRDACNKNGIDATIRVTR